MKRKRIWKGEGGRKGGRQGKRKKMERRKELRKKGESEDRKIFMLCAFGDFISENCALFLKSHP